MLKLVISGATDRTGFLVPMIINGIRTNKRGVHCLLFDAKRMVTLEARQKRKRKKATTVACHLSVGHINIILSNVSHNKEETNQFL